MFKKKYRHLLVYGMIVISGMFITNHLTAQISKFISVNSRFLTSGSSVYIQDLMKFIPGTLYGSSGGTSASEVWEVNITNTNSVPLTLNLKISVYKDGNLISEGNPLSTIDFPTGITTFRNTDFLKPGGKYFLQNYANYIQNINSLANAVDNSAKISETVLPNGTYTITLTIINPGSPTDIVQSTASITVSNPTGYVELLLPGMDPSQINADTEILTKTPIFCWIGDAPSYTISIWEDVRGNGNFTDVSTTTPLVQQTSNSRFYQYSIANPELIPGKGYFWQVASVIPMYFRPARMIKSNPLYFKISSKILTNLVDQTQKEIESILSLLDGVDVSSLRGGSIVEYTIVYQGEEIRSTDLKYLLKVLKNSK